MPFCVIPSDSEESSAWMLRFAQHDKTKSVIPNAVRNPVHGCFTSRVRIANFTLLSLFLLKERDVAERQGEVAIPSPCEGKGPEGEVKVPVAAWGYDAESVHSVFGDSEQVALAVRPCYRRQIFQVRRLPARGQLQLLR